MIFYIFCFFSFIFGTVIDKKNRNLWEELEELVNKNKVDWLWVKGHAGNVENERADFLAREEINKIK